MKKYLFATIALVVLISACGSKEASNNDGEKIGLVVTKQSALEDKSFTQGIWEGMQTGADEYGMSEKYVVSSSESTADIVSSMDTLISGGYTTIFSAGFQFMEAISESAPKNPDVNYILVDNEVDEPNVTPVLFKEEQGGFQAGVIAALSSKTGKVAFVGGMEIPPVQKFAWGFEAGVAYANAQLGTKVSMIPAIYAGKFDDVQGGAAIGAALFDQGVDVVMHAAGGTGVGVINEAKNRDNVWVIGVDVDQYEDGMKEDGTSVILTSSLKNVNSAIVEILSQINDGSFKPGETYMGDASNGGIGLPEKNPNLDSTLKKQADDVLAKLADGSIVAPATQKELTAYLEEVAK